MKFLVLVVEDDPDQLTIRSMLLRQHGFSVVEAATVESALSVARLQCPDSAILDLRLPTVKEGLRLLTELKLADPERPVYVLTGAHLAATAVLPQLQSCDGLFQKGTSIVPLVKALTALRNQLEIRSCMPSA